jgi:hypothetical protein
MNIGEHNFLAFLAPTAMALVVVVLLPGNFLPSANTTFSDSFRPTGHVQVTVERDGVVISSYQSHNLITNAGKDFISAQLGSTSPGANGANYIALTNTAITPAAGDTTLSGEISTNGLARAQGAYAHTNGQNTFTVTKTFTATGAQSAQAAGLFTASSAGTMMAENTFTAVSLQAGDSITITWTITLA